MAGVTAGGVLAADCSDFVDITVRDGDREPHLRSDRHRTRSDEQEQIMPCYHVGSAEGAWKIRASLPGRADAVSTDLTIERRE